MTKNGPFLNQKCSQCNCLLQLMHCLKSLDILLGGRFVIVKLMTPNFYGVVHLAKICSGTMCLALWWEGTLLLLSNVGNKFRLQAWSTKKVNFYSDYGVEWCLFHNTT